MRFRKTQEAINFDLQLASMTFYLKIDRPVKCKENFPENTLLSDFENISTNIFPTFFVRKQNTLNFT